MKQVPVTIPRSNQNYEIFITNGLSSALSSMVSYLESGTSAQKPFLQKIAIITDQQVAERWLKPVQDTLSQMTSAELTPIVLHPGESEKNIVTVKRIWKVLLESGFDRRSLVLTIGGGVIGDMGGFAASTFMRGIEFIQIPTTLLAMVDASIGGKTGINFGGIKNSIGTFRQPKAVVIATQFLQTLPERELLSGWAEIIKHGLILDAAYLEAVTAKRPSEYSADEIASIIHRSCELKAQIVTADETEGGDRKKLNFGHTIGHAIEAYLHEYAAQSDTDVTPFTHGEAIAVGMVAEAYLSWKNGLIQETVVHQIEDAITTVGLPIRLPPQFCESEHVYQELYQKMLHDKKNTNGTIQFALLKALGKAIYDVTVEEDKIRESIAVISCSTNA